MKNIRRGMMIAAVLSVWTFGLMSLTTPAVSAAPQGQFCGGIAGIPCPEGFKCVDVPGDGCDPQHGGADCPGICRRAH
jgi:hypothetical protein